MNTVANNIVQEIEAMEPVSPINHRTPVAIDVNQPWSNWDSPFVNKIRLKELDMRLDRSFERVDDPAVIFATDDDRVLGDATTHGLRLLSEHVQFPTDFVQKLQPELRAAVINERINAVDVRDRELSIITREGRVIGVNAGWREAAPYDEVAQLAHDTIQSVYGRPLIDRTSFDDRGAHLRFLLPIEQPITRSRGDVLQMGLNIDQLYGESIRVSLFALRLACLNGMTSSEQAFSWTQRAASSIEHQLQWTRIAIADALGAYENLIDRARLMAQHEVHGDAHTVLREHARAMRLPQRQVANLLAAYDEEPMATSWGMLNAFTRLATHVELPGDLAQRLMNSAGEWVANFDLVSCRLPRPMAIAAGAEIISD